MALPIASIPVLTGNAARQFEAQAQANYQSLLNRTEEETKADAEALEKGFASKMMMPSKKLASESLIASAKAADAAVKIARIELVLIPSCDKAIIAMMTIKTVLMIVLKKFKTISS